MVYELLNEHKLARFYQLREGAGTPVSDIPNADRDLPWLEESLRQSNDGETYLHVDIQGLHCSACVWLIEKTFSQQPGGRKLLVNPALGTLECWFGQDFQLRRWIHSIEQFGYRVGPALKTRNPHATGLVIRLGLCAAIALNVTMLSAPLHLGLHEGRLYEVFRSSAFALTSLSVLIGGPIFFRSAFAGLRRGILHLDVPISVGIMLAYAGSSWGFWTDRDNALYVDSVSVFIALMLAGRYLQERILAANRNRLLASEGSASLRSKRLRAGTIETIKSTDIQSDDQLLIAHGELIPVRSTLRSESATISTDWIDGESQLKWYSAQHVLPAGSFNAGSKAIEVIALGTWDTSSLEALLRPSLGDIPNDNGLARNISSIYVVAVLLAAILGFGGWMLLGHDSIRALEVAVGVLVVTCPCTFGIAVPLAHQLTQTQLRKNGFFLRKSNFLSIATRIKKIVFDKTGTLSTGVAPESVQSALETIIDNERQRLFSLSAQSTHPTARLIADALSIYGLPLLHVGKVKEVPGKGVELLCEGRLYRLGWPAWASDAHGNGTVFSIDKKIIARFHVDEQPRSDAVEQIRALRGDGYQLYIVSGDKRPRVEQFAESVGLPLDHVYCEQTPEEKQQWILAHDHGDLLFVGDGINDSLATQSATCSGTPTVARPFIASHSDFYLATEQLAPIRLALRAAHTLRRIIRRNIVFAIVYNVGAILLAWGGVMKPWLAAILMPSSSLLVIITTNFSLAPRSKQWTS